MLEVKKIQGTAKTIVTLDGVVDESLNLGEDLKDLQKEVEFYCIGIKRINSTGIKKWITYFNQLRDRGVSFTFHQVSSSLIEQFNLISNFGCGGTVSSVALPYTCKACSHQNLVVKEKSELVGINLDQCPWPCSECSKVELEFDDISDEYLNFWK